MGLSVIAIIVGYLLGSILPAYLIARFLKGFDIRERGTRNPGVSNAAKTMNHKIAALVAVYDLSKAPLAMIIASYLQVPTYIIYLSGVAVILGHIAPFYLKFRGGRGLSVAVGISFYSLISLLFNDWHFVYIMGFFLILVSVIFFFRVIRTGSSEISLIILPLCLIACILYYGVCTESMVFLLASTYIIGERVSCLWRDKKPSPQKEEIAALRRRLLMLLTAVFPIGIFFFRIQTLISLGTVLLFFIVLEVLRFSGRLKVFSFLYSSGEGNRVSSAQVYLFSIFLTLLVFKLNIAALAVLFLIFGDFIIWIVDFSLGGKRFLTNTLQGTLAGLIICILVASIFYKLSLVSLWQSYLGATVTIIMQVVPIENKKFAVPIVSSIAMSLA